MRIASKLRISHFIYLLFYVALWLAWQFHCLTENGNATSVGCFKLLIYGTCLNVLTHSLVMQIAISTKIF
jgi:hypothetical protein